MKGVRERVTFANAMSVTAVFIALGGTAFAVTLGNNTVGSPQLKRGAVKTADIAASAVTSGKVKNENLKGLDVLNDSLTGDDILESSLGQVSSALNATNAQTAANATNAQNAASAANATNADTADFALQAGDAGEAVDANRADALYFSDQGQLTTVRTYSAGIPENTPFDSVFASQGLNIEVGCPADAVDGADIQFDAQAPSTANSVTRIHAVDNTSVAHFGGASTDSNDVDMDFGEPTGAGTLVYATTDGAVVVVDYMWENQNNGFGATDICAFAMSARITTAPI